MQAVIPLRFESNTVQAFVHDGEPWFVLPCLRDVLVIAPGKRISTHLDDAERGFAVISTPEGQRRLVVLNLSGLHTVVSLGEPATAQRFRRWIAAEALPALLSLPSATLLPQPPREGLFSTTEIAEDIGMLPTTLGRRAKRLKRHEYGEWRPAIGMYSEAVIEQWWWNAAGRRAVLRKFAKFGSRAFRAA